MPKGGLLNLLVINGGSSSIKFSLFATNKDAHDPSLILGGELSGIGTPEAALAIVQGKLVQEKLLADKANNPAAAISVVFDAIRCAEPDPIDAVGYRVVHPGAEIRDHVRITDEVLNKLEVAASFAPLHDPDALTTIFQPLRRSLR